MPKVKLTPEEYLARFWARMDKSGGPDACWPWLGHRSPRGYGQSSDLDRKTVRAHRMAWELTFGPFDRSLFVCHRCDNPPCCNPTNLFLGTTNDNMADMVAKGRAAVGERQGSAVLNEDLVREIRASRESRPAIAKRLGIGTATVDRVRRRLRWRHV